MSHRDELAKIIDDADNTWQHGVGNSGADWKDFIAEAVLNFQQENHSRVRELAKEVVDRADDKLKLDVPEYDYVNKTPIRCKMGIHQWSIWTWPAGYRICFQCNKREDA